MSKAKLITFRPKTIGFKPVSSSHADTPYDSLTLEPIFVSFRVDGKTLQFMVPEGFRTDFNSVPRIFHRIARVYDRYVVASIIHDWLFVVQPEGVTVSHANQIYGQVLKKLGADWMDRTVKRVGVGLGGWLPWRRNAKILEDEKSRKDFWRRSGIDKPMYEVIR